MKRRQLVELEDLPWWPQLFRDATTDYLATALRITKTYARLAPILAAALKRCGSTQIIDLCSGSGGPWPTLLPALRAAGVEASVCLTDKYPNVSALTNIARQVPDIRFEAGSVSATDVPPRLAGFRTMFTAFHHFSPEDARAILTAAVRDREGIAIFEATSRSATALATMLLIPLAVWLMTPAVRPFRWSRLFWTYVVPVVPLVITFDGIVSCLRIYTPEQMLVLAQEAGGDTFEWEAGVEHPPGSPFPIPYLIGIPRRAKTSRTFAMHAESC